MGSPAHLSDRIITFPGRSRPLNICSQCSKHSEQPFIHVNLFTLIFTTTQQSITLWMWKQMNTLAVRGSSSSKGQIRVSNPGCCAAIPGPALHTPCLNIHQDTPLPHKVSLWPMGKHYGPAYGPVRRTVVQTTNSVTKRDNGGENILLCP